MTRAQVVGARAVLVMAAVFAPISMAGAVAITSPDFAHLPALTARTVSQGTGEVLFTTRAWIEPVERDGEHLVAVQSQVFNPIGTTVDARTLMRVGATVRCLEQENRVRAADGSTLSINMKQFRPEAIPFGATSMPDDTYPPGAALLYLLGSLPLDHAGRSSFHVLGETDVWRIDASDDGMEEIAVPAGRFPCRRVRLRPDPDSLHFPGFLRPFVRYFVPDFEAWIALDAPHLAVRIKGPLGPPRERDVIVELVATDAVAP